MTPEIAAALERFETWQTASTTKPGEEIAMLHEMARLLRESQPEPAPPAVGEDEALLAAARVNATAYRALYEQDGAVTGLADHIDTLAARLRALLADAAHTRKALERAQGAEADLARLVNERDRALADVARLMEMLAAERKFSGDAAARSLASAKERDKALATLAAVRKIADDYHDVDVRGTPPREVATNPCANEVLLALDGKP